MVLTFSQMGGYYVLIFIVLLFVYSYSSKCSFFNICYFDLGCTAIDAATQLTGYISHANYPNKYSNNVNCIFVINAPPGRKIKLRFEEFALEFHETCKFDYLEVQGIEGAKPTGKFCGTEKPADVISKGSSLTVKFVSDYATTLSGFLIRWNVELENTLPTLSPITS